MKPTEKTNSVENLDFTNDIVEQHFSLGDASLRPFKKIIKRVMYPADFSRVYFATYVDTIEAFNKMNGDNDGMVELSVYGLEALVYYTLDACDLEDELYFLAENLFEKVNDLVNDLTLEPQVKKTFLARLAKLKEHMQHSECYNAGLVC